MSGRVVHHVASEDNPRPTGKERIQRALAVAPNNRRGDVGEHESAHTEKRKELVRCATFTAREACSSRNKATRWRRQREHVPNTPTKCRPRSEPIRKSSHDCDSAEIETRSLFAIAVSCDIADRNPDGGAAAAVRCRSKSWWEGHDAMPATRSASSSHGDERANVSVSLARGGVATPSRRCPWPRKAARRISYAKV